MNRPHPTRLLRLLPLCAALLAACTDSLFEPLYTTGDGEADGIAFGTAVVEQADLLYQIGRTRAAQGAAAVDSQTIATLTSTARPLQGSTAQRLYLHRHSLPLVGIHPHTVRAAQRAGTPAEATTRAPESSIIKTGSDAINFHDSLTIWGYVLHSDNTTQRILFNQVLLKKIRGFRSSVHWPYDEGAATTMRFYAVAPALECMEDLTLSGTAPSYGQPPSFSFAVPEVGQQRDLLYGESNIIDVQKGPKGDDTQKEPNLGQDNKEVRLTFRHILTTIRFAQGKMPTNLTINQIQLHDILYRGTFTPGETATDDKWDTSGYTDKRDYTLNLATKDATGYQAASYEVSSNTYIDQQQVLFLMPHTLTKAAKLNITLTDAGNHKHTLSCDLKGDEWAPGHTVTYVITIGEVAEKYYLQVEKEPVIQEHATKDITTPTNEHYPNTFTIHSYRNFLDYAKQADGWPNKHYGAKWKVVGFSTDGNAENVKSTKPEWLTSITGWGSDANGDADATTVTYTLEAQSSIYNTELNHQTVLKNNKECKEMNLAEYEPDGTKENGNKRSTSESANCYIVNAAGTYSFPEVYGNTLKGGIDVAASLNSLNLFTDNNGKPIKHAYINEQTCYEETSDVTSKYTTDGTFDTVKRTTRTYYDDPTTVSEDEGGLTAALVWQDDKEVISAVEHQLESKVISFTVTTDITPCNAIIALVATKKTTVTTVQKYKGNTEVDSPKTETVTENVSDTLWTWHIWVTDEVYPNNLTVEKKDAFGNKRDESVSVDKAYPSYNTTTNSKIAQLQDEAGNELANIMPTNLGWKPDELTWKVYEPREIYVHIEQEKDPSTGEANTVIVKLRQEAYPEPVRGTSTLYQWGRPTALPMPLKVSSSKKDNVTNKETNVIYHINFNSEGKSTSTEIKEFAIVRSTDETPGYAIAHPRQMVRYKDSPRWHDTYIDSKKDVAQYWGKSDDGKTIYDPSPPGFHVAPNEPFKVLRLKDKDANAAINTMPKDAVTANYLNMWPDVLDANNDRQQSGKEKYGGFFYTKQHTYDGNNKDVANGQHDANPWGIPAKDRYSSVVYMPSSGSVEIKTEANYMSDSHGDWSNGRIWCREGTSSSGTGDEKVYKAYYIMYVPDYDKAEKVYERVTTEHTGDAMPVRPVAE